MANNFKLPSITTTVQEVAVYYPQPDGTFEKGVLVTQYKVINNSEVEVIGKQLKERTESGESIGEAEIKIAHLNEVVLGITNVIDDNDVPRPALDAKKMCLDNPITRNALWEGYRLMLNKSSETDK